MNRHFRALGLIATIALFCFGLSANYVLAGADTPDDGARGPQPGSSSDQSTKKKRNQSQLELRDGYLRARALILDGKYKPGIAALHSLDDDESPDVANYLGYASRKLGDYDAAKYWDDEALGS